MGNKLFEKKDEGFVCQCCGALVEPLGYTSRDHCNVCLSSIHVDNNPGDRSNNCHGLMKPVGVELNNKKGYVIKYKCTVCGELHNNKAANDDSFEAILSLSNGTYDHYLRKILDIKK